MTKEHGRVEDRRLWQVAVNPSEVGLAGVAQLVRIDRHVDTVRRGQVIKHTEETAYGITTLWTEEADGERLLQVAREHWLIENGQHYRRDRTQDEDRCTVRETNSARVLSLFRSLTIYLYEAQRRQRGGKRSLPDYEKHVHRRPTGLIGRFLNGTD